MLGKRYVVLTFILIFVISILVGCDSSISAGYIINVRLLQASISGSVVSEKTETACVISEETLINSGFNAIEASHRYWKEGTYTVTITMKDKKGKSYSTTQEIAVLNTVEQRQYKNSSSFMY